MAKEKKTAPPQGKPDGDFEKVVEALATASLGPCGLIRKVPSPSGHPLPSRGAVAAVAEDLRAALFPGFFGTPELHPESLRFHVGSLLSKVRQTLHDQILCGLCFACDKEEASCDHPKCEQKALAMTMDFIRSLPEMRRILATDVKAHYEGDPAALTPDETILCYPGMLAISSQRIAHALSQLGIPLIPRMITEAAHSATGIDIHPGAAIGDSFFIDHGTGVVIGETCRIGKRVRIYQGVTLGAKSFPLDKDGNPIKGIDRHPIVEDDVTIYAGATILGRITIGKGSVIGGNVWVTRSVPPDSRINQARAS